MRNDLELVIASIIYLRIKQLPADICCARETEQAMSTGNRDSIVHILVKTLYNHELSGFNGTVMKIYSSYTIKNTYFNEICKTVNLF